MRPVDGLLLVDKPAGWTSHDAVAYVRKALGEKRAGHTGTLDPGATGLLILLVGRATRLARYYEADEKGYLAVMRLGAVTDTQDASGRVTRECPAPPVTREDVLAVFEKFTGEVLQVPPMYSAVKVGGSPLYKRARKGEEVERAHRKVFVHRLRLEGIDGPRIAFEARCSKGTYIRTLAADMGEALGSCAHLESLRRTRVGLYGAEDALPLEGRPSGEETSARLIGLDGLLPDTPSLMVSPEAARGVKDGRPPSEGHILRASGGLAAGGTVRVLDESGGLIAMAEAAGHEGTPFPLRLRVVLA